MIRSALGTPAPARFVTFFMNQALDALGPLVGRLGGRIGFGDEHVAIGQHVNPARMVQPARQRSDLEPDRGRGHGALGPALGRGDVDGGNQAPGRRRQRGIGAFVSLRRQAGDVAAGRQRGAGKDNQQSQYHDL